MFNINILYALYQYSILFPYIVRTLLLFFNSLASVSSMVHVSLMVFKRNVTSATSDKTNLNGHIERQKKVWLHSIF